MLQMSSIKAWNFFLLFCHRLPIDYESWLIVYTLYWQPYMYHMCDTVQPLALGCGTFFKGGWRVVFNTTAWSIILGIVAEQEQIKVMYSCAQNITPMQNILLEIVNLVILLCTRLLILGTKWTTRCFTIMSRYCERSAVVMITDTFPPVSFCNRWKGLINIQQ